MPKIGVIVSGIKHGTNTGYAYHKCKCKACLKAGREYGRLNARRQYARDPERARKRASEWKKKNRDRVKLWERRWREKNADKYKAGQKERNRRARLNRHGITAEFYDSLYKVQGGVCAICGEKFKRRLSIDHSHANQSIRGLLCHHCNAGLGQFFDNPNFLQKAIDYLNMGGTVTLLKLDEVPKSKSMEYSAARKPFLKQ